MDYLNILKEIGVNEEYEYTIYKNIKSKKLNLLQIMILKSNNDTIKNFLKNNIHLFKDDINYQNEKGWTVLMMACCNSNHYSNNEIVKLLLENAHVEGIRYYDTYRKNGGYRAVEKALKMTPDEVVEEVKKKWFAWPWWCRLSYGNEMEFLGEARRRAASLGLQCR